jgi:hypothetical protein
MRAQEAVDALKADVLEYMNDVLSPDFCSGIRPIAKFLGISREMTRATLLELRDEGLVTYERGLFTEDGEVAGSGYGITMAGRALYREHIAPETATPDPEHLGRNDPMRHMQPIVDKYKW